MPQGRLRGADEKRSQLVNKLTAETSKGGVSAAVLKYTAVALMILNHLTTTLFDFVFEVPDLVDLLFVLVTRASFILFAFLTAEGLAHTSSRTKYFLRMVIFAAASEPFFDLCFQGGFFDFSYQNVFFTHALAIAGVAVEERMREKTKLSKLVLLLPMAAALLLRCDYSLFGVGVIYIFYYFRTGSRRTLFLMLTAACLALLPVYRVLNELIFGSGELGFRFWLSAFASGLLESAGLVIIPLIDAYNGSRGKQINKYVWYAVYPAHLLLLGALRWAVTQGAG